MNLKRILIAAAALAVIGATTFFLTRKSNEERVARLLEDADRYQEQGSHETAVIVLRNALRIMPDNGAIHVRLADSYAQAGNPRDSLKHYDAAVRYGVSDEDFLRAYGHICLQYNAIRELAKPAGRLLQLRPDNAEAHYWMALSIAADQPQQAILHAEKAVVPQPGKQPEPRAYLLLADLYVRDRKHEKAERCLRGALEQLPGNAQLMAGLAAAEVGVGQDAEARRHIEAAIAATEGADSEARLPVYTIAADIYRQLKMNPRGIDVCRQLVKMAPHNPAFRMALAQQYLIGNKIKEAEALLTESIDKDPAEGRFRILMAEILLRSDRAKEAQTYLEELPADLASLPRTFYLKGLLLLTLGETRNAEPLLKRARNENPDLVRAQVALGACYLQMDLLQSAATELEGALSKEPNNTEAVLWLARCKQAQGDFAAAETLARSVIAADENNERAREVLLACKMQTGEMDEIESLLNIKNPKEAPAEDMLKVAQALAMHNRADEAMKTLEAALQKDPGLAGAISLKARILEFTGNLDEAEALFRRLAASHPKSDRWVAELAGFLQRNGKQDDARDVLLELTRRVPESAAAHKALGVYYQTLGNLTEAAASFLIARELNPKDMDTRRRLVQALIRNDDTDTAHAEVQQIKTDFGEAMDVLALEGILLLAQDRPDEALACFKSLSKRWPKEPTGPILIGTAYARKGDFGSAVAAFETARNIDPRDVRARMRLRDAYLAVGLYDKAAEEAKQVINLKPPAADDVHKFALSLAGSRKTNQACALLEKLSANTPDKAEYHVHLAMLLATEGNTQHAENEMQKALAMDRSPQTLWAACTLYWQNGKQQTARELIESVADDVRLYHSLLAQHHAAAGDFEKAETEFKKLVELAPGDPTVLCTLGDFYASRPEWFDKAMHAYQKALEMKPDLVYAQRRAAVLLAKAGKLGEAEGILAGLAQEHPNDVYVQARLAELAIEWMRLVQSREVTDAAVRRCSAFAENFPHIARAHYLVALAHYLAAPPDYDAAEAALMRTSEVAPGLGEAKLLRARICLATRRITHAERECRELLGDEPDNIDAMLLLGDAMSRREAKTYDYEMLARQFPDNTAAKLMLGIVIYDKDPARSERVIGGALGESPPWRILKTYCDFLNSRGRAAEAILRMQAFVTENPRFPEGYRSLADAQAAADNMPAAIRAQRRAYALSAHGFADLRRTIAMMVNATAEADAISLIKEHLTRTPKDNGARLLLAQVLGKAGRVDEAIKEAAALVKEEPDSAEARLTLATAHLIRKRYEEALRHYRVVLMRDASNHTAANNVAFILAEHFDRPEEAERVILPALHRFRDSATIQDTYGWILYRRGKLDDARDALQRSMKLDPNESITMFHLAVVCKELADMDRARALLSRALEIDASFEKADAARKLLQSME